MTQTFRELENSKGNLRDFQQGNSLLEQWYNAVRDVPIVDLQDGDLCRACRQQLFLEYLVPVAAERLRLRPLAGDLYDGELFASLKEVPVAYWKDNPATAATIRTVVDGLACENMDERLADDIEAVISKVDFQ